MKYSFEYPEDEEFFDDLFKNHGGIECNIHHFDFRSPEEKRNEALKFGTNVIVYALSN